MILLLQTTGWLLAHTPEALLHLFSWMLGPVIMLMPRRRHILYSNLHHAFPDKPRAWHTRVARKSCRRLIETSMLSLASPYLSPARKRCIGYLSQSMIAGINRRAAEGARRASRPDVIGTFHVAYWECLTWLGFYTSYRCEVGVVFRPLGNKTLNDWIKKTREQHGMKLLSRRDGMMEVFRVLRRGGIVSILFDQNAGGPGALTTLLGRVCSTSELSGALAEKYKARLSVIHTVRTGFWRIRYEVTRVKNDGTVAGATIAMNRWLENALASDANLRDSWLWSHARWKSQNEPSRRFRLEAKHDFLDADLAARGWTRATMPRNTRVWLRMPDDAARHALLFPLLRALRQSRPDTELTLFADAPALAALEPLLADRTADFLRALPPRGIRRLAHFWKLRRGYPDVFVNLSETPSSDREAKLTRCPQRFGIARAGKRRPLLTHCYESKEGDSPLADYQNFFVHFGLPL